MKVEHLRSILEGNRELTTFLSIYGDAAGERRRFRKLLDNTVRRFDPEDLQVFSSPGRTELGGNHTDHNGGKVLAASVHLDSIAMVERRDDLLVTLHSDRYPELLRVDLHDLEPRRVEQGRPEALIRGIAASLKESGRRIGGFRGCITSNVLPGSGLSSSASVELLIASIFSSLFNRGELSPAALSLAGQDAENRFFGKPCGLMDQLACAVGGVVAIDFRSPREPAIKRIDTLFGDYGLSLVVVDTGANHEDLTADYAAVPQEMRSVAQALDREVCRDLTPEEVIGAIPELRRSVGDRAILRCLHFFADNERVDRQITALDTGDITAYLDAVRQAGDSSWELLQNNYPPGNASSQGIPLAIALSRRFLGAQAAVRIQGGGFAGTMQAYVPTERLDGYQTYIERFFGANSATPVRIRSTGATELRIE